MSDDLANGSDQGSASAESSGYGQTGGGESESIDKPGSVQPDGQGNAEGDNLPPELQEAKKQLMRDYHEKTQKLAEERRGFSQKVKDLELSHQILMELRQQEWFRKAYDSEKARKSGATLDEDLSPEDFETLKSDPRAFREYIQKYATGIIEAKNGSRMARAEDELRQMRNERELDRLFKSQPEAEKAYKAGHLDELLKQGNSYEAAFALWKLRNGGKDEQARIREEAQRILSERKAGAVDKPGVPSVKGQRVIQAGNLMEAMDKAFEAHAKGETDLVFTKPK